MLRALTLALCTAAAAGATATADADAARTEGPARRTVEGLRLAPTIQVEGRTLTLNGAGARKKLWFKVYVGALYLETPGTSADAVVDSRQTKRLELAFLRDVERSALVSNLRGGFVKNAGAELPALQERLDALLAAIPAIRRGDRLVLDFVPGKGVVTRHGGTELVVPGDDFARALLRVWLGPRATHDELYRALLAGRSG